MKMQVYGRKNLNYGFSVVSNNYNAKVYFISLISLKMILDRIDALEDDEV